MARTLPGVRTNTLLLIAALLLTLLPAPAAQAANDNACPAGYRTTSPFRDVSLSSTHGGAITCMASWNVAFPLLGSEFRPGEAATRGQFAMMLYQLTASVGKAPLYFRDPFKDVPDGHPQGAAISALADAGVIYGTTATTFAPDKPITRGQMASLIVRSNERIFKASMTRGAAFPDTLGTTHDENIRRLVGAAITQGFADGTYKPGLNITRAQMTTFHANFADLLVRQGKASRPALPRTTAPVTDVCAAVRNPALFEDVLPQIFPSASTSSYRLGPVPGHTAGGSCRVTDPVLPNKSFEVRQVARSTFDSRAASVGQSGRITIDPWDGNLSDGLPRGVLFYENYPKAMQAGTYEMGFVSNGHAYQVIVVEDGNWCFGCSLGLWPLLDRALYALGG